MEELKKFVVCLYQDTIFRCIFGREGMEVYLIALLNAIFLQFNLPMVKKLTIKNPYQLPKNESQKTTILDVFVEDETGRKIDVEMQTRDQEFFNKRMIYYAARNYVDQSRKGKDYDELYPSYVVVFTRFPIPDRPKDCWVDVQRMQSSLYPEICYDDITIIYIRIPDKPGMKIPDSVLQQLRDWICYIGSDATSESDRKEILSRNATIKSLDEVVERFTATREGHMILSREEMHQMDREAQNRLMKKRALEEGREEGMVNSIKIFLQTRFPENFVDSFQTWQTKLNEKSLTDLTSLLSLSASCTSLNEFTQKL